MLRFLLIGITLISTVHFGLFAQSPSSDSIDQSVFNIEDLTDDLRSEVQKKKPMDQRLREGTILKGEIGEFRIIGSRVMLVLENGDKKFYCLENLNLDRIMDVIRKNRVPTKWKVDFFVTEYKNENYVLIQHALLDRN